MLLLKNCKLVGELTEGTELTMADIVMNDKTITDIVPCGSIKVGKMADLVVIDGDPVEDISLMYGAPAHVIKSGEVVK